MDYATSVDTATVLSVARGRQSMVVLYVTCVVSGIAENTSKGTTSHCTMVALAGWTNMTITVHGKKVKVWYECMYYWWSCSDVDGDWLYGPYASKTDAIESAKRMVNPWTRQLPDVAAENNTGENRSTTDE